jgi:broad specificity phosphatase PhoE
MSDARGGMVRVVGAWVSGNIDTRPEGGGESGREVSSRTGKVKRCIGKESYKLTLVHSKVLNRSVTALEELVKEAEANGGTVAAVAHSKFLKVLLAVVEDMPLAQAVATQQTNCCIDVLDMKRGAPPITLGPKSNLFGGPISQAPLDFELKVPSGKIMRINEKRHLDDLEFETMVG